ncbi:CAF17-like 4Fe-4S cluster assembly/insertion protein YgfZ [Immundisolibacter sp.]
MPVLPEAAPSAPAASGAPLLMPLAHLALLQAGGADATAFLHGQLSNDVQGLAPGASLLAGYCNAKGRLFAVPRLWRMGDDWQLCLPADTAEGVLKRLRMFVLRSKVTLTLREDLTLLGVAGDSALDCLQQVGLPVPQAIDAVSIDRGVAVLRLPGVSARFQICVSDVAAPALWAALAECAIPVAGSAFRLLDIDAGLPTILAPTLEVFVPQMLNLDRVGGVSFRKGCYPGQEIVARMHYLGKPSRRMYRLRVAGGAPEPGTPLLDPAGREIGNVVDAQLADESGCRLLAVLQVTANAGTLRLPDGRPLERLPLPYALDEPSATSS